MNSIWNRRTAGLTLLELLVGVIIFTLAMLPLLSMSHSSTQGAYSIGKHLIVSQICSSVLDQILSLPYNDALALAKSFATEKVVWDEVILKIPDIEARLSGTAGTETDPKVVKEDLHKTLKTLKVSVVVSEGQGTEENEMFLVEVKVSWNMDENSDKAQHILSRLAVKYNETA